MNSQNRSTSILSGTDTEQNLHRAFEKEAENHAKGMLFARLADSDGDYSAGSVMKEQADNDLRHAELWLSYLDGLGSTSENLSDLSGTKSALNESEYQVMADRADDEGFHEIAEKMRLAGSVKQQQSSLLSDELSRLGVIPESDDPNTEWHCRCCGYTMRGNSPAEHCPLCSYPASYFARG